MPRHDFSASLASKLERNGELDPVELDAVKGLPARIVEVAADQSLVREGDRPTHSTMILHGVGCTSRTLANGRRQISALHVKEDIPDLLSLHLAVIDSDVSVLTPAVVALIDHADLRRLCDAHPRVADILWRITLVDAAIYRQWVTNVGQRHAEQRIAHLFLEMMTRLEAVGLSDGRRCAFPLTQTDLSEATGLSTVHVNRSLQSLRGRGLIELERGFLTLPMRREIEQFAEFSSAYLHLPARSRAATGGDALVLV